jgi:hypothetical protein
MSFGRRESGFLQRSISGQAVEKKDSSVFRDFGLAGLTYDIRSRADPQSDIPRIVEIPKHWPGNTEPPIPAA